MESDDLSNNKDTNKPINNYLDALIRKIIHVYLILVHLFM